MPLPRCRSGVPRSMVIRLPQYQRLFFLRRHHVFLPHAIPYYNFGNPRTHRWYPRDTAMTKYDPFRTGYQMYRTPSLFFSRGTFDPSSSSGGVRSLRDSRHLSPVHAAHFGIYDWISSPPPRRLSSHLCFFHPRSHAFNDGKNRLCS